MVLVIKRLKTMCDQYTFQGMYIHIL